MPRTLSPTEQQGVALGFIMREQHEVAAAKPVSPGETCGRHTWSYVSVTTWRDPSPLAC
ncbi:hypothetical protein PHMEG_00036620 [Phytophthora megakarya]|uniref:Uncharacterized protein n=1 Tax=Phytophthora megakarya TaxID=4795 RepID=A0A225ULM9_9STRA|nr:hypothetical protein PHMEG_00036620 [Phytophthora megakarya]